MLLEQPVARAHARCRNSSPVTRRHELLTLCGLPEYIKDARRRRGGRFPQYLLDPFAQLVLLKEFLKSLQPCDVPVLESVEPIKIHVRLQARGHNQQLPRIPPGRTERIGTFLR